MIDYDSFGRPPRRGHGRVARTVIVAAAIVGVLAVLIVAHVVSIGRPTGPLVTANPTSGGPPPTSATVASAVTSPAGELTLGACLDPTSSIVSSFAPSIRSDLAQAVAGLAPSAGQMPTNTLSGRGPVTSPQSGVNLTVRQVGTDSYSSDLGQYVRNVAVPPVPGLPGQRPEPGPSDYVTQLRNWTAGYQVVAAARQAAHQAAAAGAASIASMPLNTLAWSGISACISALLTTVPPSGAHSYLLASDLEENRPQQLAGSFRGAPLVIIQTCDTGNVAYCQQLLQTFIQVMRHLDVGQITVVRPEDAANAITLWIQTGNVTS